MAHRGHTISLPGITDRGLRIEGAAKLVLSSAPAGMSPCHWYSYAGGAVFGKLKLALSNYFSFLFPLSLSSWSCWLSRSWHIWRELCFTPASRDQISREFSAGRVVSCHLIHARLEVLFESRFFSARTAGGARLKERERQQETMFCRNQTARATVARGSALEMEIRRGKFRKSVFLDKSQVKTPISDTSYLPPHKNGYYLFTTLADL